MSQNKTVIQGLEPADPKMGGAPRGGVNQNFYSRNTRPAASRGTVVPGMMDSMADPAISSEPSVEKPVRKAPVSGKPVVGFLYSISRTPVGEYWPIQIGPNTIGQSADSDIQLAEGTISSNHAVLVTRQVKNGIIAAITDSKSTNGTMINGETIGFSAEECHDGDIITIGNNYEFLLVLIDAAKRGLSVSKDFIPVELEQPEEEEDEFEDDVPMFNPGGNSTRPGFDPSSSAWGGGTSGGYSPAGGTVGLDGSVAGGNHGGTVPL